MRFLCKYTTIVILSIATVSVLVLYYNLKLLQNEKPVLVPSCQDTISNEDFTIKLTPRQYLPEAEINSGISWLKEYPYDRVHVLLQFCKPKDPVSMTIA